MLGHAETLEMDSAGRILLPARLRDLTGLDKDVALVGMGNRFELWNAEEWTVRPLTPWPSIKPIWPNTLETLRCEHHPFVHLTVLLTEAVDALAIRPDGTYVDCTFGRGGHNRLILSRLGPQGRLVAFDKDPEAIAVATRLAEEDPRFQIVHNGFENAGTGLERLGIPQVDGVLMDLGVSSPQIDDERRGFSFRFDAPWTCVDTTRGITAAEWLATADEADIREVIKTYGEERFARKIAAIVAAADAPPHA